MRCHDMTWLAMRCEAVLILPSATMRYNEMYVMSCHARMMRHWPWCRHQLLSLMEHLNVHRIMMRVLKAEDVGRESDGHRHGKHAWLHMGPVPLQSILGAAQCSAAWCSAVWGHSFMLSQHCVACDGCVGHVLLITSPNCHADAVQVC
jgi:hypothetical protein